MSSELFRRRACVLQTAALSHCGDLTGERWYVCRRCSRMRWLWRLPNALYPFIGQAAVCLARADNFAGPVIEVS